MTINETFVGYRLTTASRDRLLKRLPAQYDTVVADHITTDFLGNQPFFPGRKRGTVFLPPKPKNVLVIGHAHDPQRGIHAAVISIDGKEHQGMDPDRRLHVTISHGKNARPVHSNDAIKKGWTRLDKPIPIQVIPMSHLEEVRLLVDTMIESRDLPHEIRQATPETQQKFASALKSGLEHRQQVKQRLSQYDDVIKGVSSHIGQPAYLVGGAVRDAFLGRENKDVDLVTVGGQKKLEDLGYKQIKGDFPVYTHPKFPGVEVALARGEKKVGAGHTGFAWHTAKSLDPDLQRRDLTVNAMAYHPDKGIIDPHGGQRDIADGYLRHVGKHFAEDPLRSFRVARFASQTGMEVHPSTIAMMRSTKKELPSLSKDRVREEMAKALKSKAPRQYFDTLHKAGILKVWHPEVAALKGKPSSLPHHGDAYEHTMSSLQHASETGQHYDVKHLLLTQQMPEASIAKHGERFGMSKQEVSRLQTHASVHTVPFQHKGSADQSISYWAKTQPNSLQPDHQAATAVNASVSGTGGNRDHYQQVFDRLGGVKFSAADFQGKKGPEISQYKQHRWKDALSGLAETVSQLVDLMIEGRVRVG